MRPVSANASSALLDVVRVSMYDNQIRWVTDITPQRADYPPRGLVQYTYPMVPGALSRAAQLERQVSWDLLMRSLHQHMYDRPQDPATYWGA